MNAHYAPQFGKVSIDEGRVRRLAEAIDCDIESRAYDGLALKVSIGDELVIDIQRGFADRGAGVAVNAATVFATMSTGKQFLTTLFLSYVERGLLSLTAPQVGQFGVTATRISPLRR